MRYVISTPVLSELRILPIDISFDTYHIFVILPIDLRLPLS